MKPYLLLSLSFLWFSSVTHGGTLGGSICPDGVTRVQVDLPENLRLRNKSGRDGAGLCVFTSLEMAAEWNNIVQLFGFRDYMTQFRGGGWPEKVDDYIGKLCSKRGLVKPEYIQVISSDLEILRVALACGRMVSVTYSVSATGRYGGRRIAHMVNLVHAGPGQAPDGRGWYGILDNNYTDKHEWLSEKEFVRTACYPGGKYWAVIFLNPSPPPNPFRERTVQHVPTVHVPGPLFPVLIAGH